MQRSRPHPAAFTLIELLVVISIIALLVAMLLPVAGAARDRSRTVICMGNHKQLFMAISMYGSDFQQLVPGGPWPTTTSPDQGFPVQYRDHWYTGGSILWTDRRHTQMMLGIYIDPRNPGWMCPGWPRTEVLSTTATTVGSPENPNNTALPWTMGNLGAGYNYRPWIRKKYQWPGWENYQLHLEKPRKTSAADLFACILWDDQTNPALLAKAPHDGRKYWNISFVDGSVRATAGYRDPTPTWNMLGNYPPDAVWADWTARQ